MEQTKVKVSISEAARETGLSVPVILHILGGGPKNLTLTINGYTVVNLPILKEWLTTGQDGAK